MMLKKKMIGGTPLGATYHLISYYKQPLLHQYLAAIDDVHTLLRGLTINAATT
jgi:hypothetical protein